MNDVEYFRRRAADARALAARAEGYARSIHLELAERYAERERLAAQQPRPARVPAL